MEIRYFKHYSSHLGRDMEFKVYGSGGGKPVMFIPARPAASSILKALR